MFDDGELLAGVCAGTFVFAGGGTCTGTCFGKLVFPSTFGSSAIISRGGNWKKCKSVALKHSFASACILVMFRCAHDHPKAFELLGRVGQYGTDLPPTRIRGVLASYCNLYKSHVRIAH